MNSQFVYTKQRVAPVLFEPNVLSTVVGVQVAGYSGQISLPKLELPTNDRPNSNVHAPNNLHADTLGELICRDPLFSWGHQVAQPGGESYIEAFLFEFSLPKTKAAATSCMSEIDLHFDHWITALTDWLEVLSHQDLSIKEPLGTDTPYAIPKGNYHLWSWKARSVWKVTGGGTAFFAFPSHALDTAISINDWKRAIQRANEKVKCPIPRLLLRDARANFRRRRFRTSAIFCGIVTELVMKKQIEHELQAKHNPQPFIHQILNQTLGRLESTCRALSIDLPSSIGHDLIKTRNRAAHWNEEVTITQEEARKALEVASALVANNAPI